MNFGEFLSGEGSAALTQHGEGKFFFPNDLLIVLSNA